MSRPQESNMHKPIVTEPRRVDADDSGSEYSDSEDDRAGTYAAAGNEELDEWSEGGEDDAEADEPSTCLFCSNRSASLVELRSHMQSAHSFDFRAVSQRLQLDFYAQMKLINYIREKTSNKESDKVLVERLNAANAHSSADLRFFYDGSESYLKPFLNDDSLLFSLPKNFQNKAGSKEEDDEEEEQPEENAAAAPFGQEEQKSDASPASSSAAPSVTGLLQENQSLRNELESMQEAMRAMQATLKRVAFADEESADVPPALATAASSSASSVAPAAVAAAKPAKASSSSNPGSFAPEHVDRDYFGGYSTRNIHELMLRDTIRTEAYRDFMYKSGELFKDKVVLDVGCGTGILSMFAAKMGAKKVIGVDAADIVHKAREIISTNGLSNVIEIVHGKMEEVTLPVDKVDIIISEWMGYFLLFESMLPSVLYARDRYLRATPSASQSPAEATGVYPDKAIMYIGGIETSEAVKHRVDWWSDVYGFNMSCLVEEREKFQSSTVEIVRPHQVITDLVLLKEFDCNFVVDAALDFESDFVITFNDKSAQKPFTGFMVYFDTLFALHCKTVINLSTAPMKDHSPQPELTTHWMQSVFYLAKPLNVKQGDSIRGKLKANRMKINCRAYDVVIEYTHVSDGKDGASQVQEYKVQ